MDSKNLELCKNIGKEGVETLKTKTVSIIGLGGVGTTASQILARNGVKLRVVDKNRVLKEEMPRMTLYQVEDIGKFKAKQIKKRLEEINSNVQVKVFHEDLREENAFLLDADLIIDVSNNFKTSLFVNEYAQKNNIPLVFCNYSGYEGNVITIDKKQHKGPCIACLEKKLKLPPHTKEGVFSPLSTLFAGIVASVAFKNLLGIENLHCVLHVDVLEAEIKHVEVTNNKDCKFCIK